MSIQRKTIENDEKFLRQISTEVNFEKDDYMKWIEALKEYCKNNSVYALAPVQIGIPKRIIYLKNTSEDMEKNKDSNYSEDLIYINPVILNRKGRTRFLEGCASCSFKMGNEEKYYVGVVDRPYLLEVEYFDINGEKKIETISDFKATIFSHEYDHLNGVLHMDLIDNIMEMTLEEMKIYRDNNPYEIISKDED